MGGEKRRFDRGKKVKGRKRHLLVDTEGFVLKAHVHSAKVMDQVGIKTLLRRAYERRGVGVRCHDPPHDEADRPCLRAFHTASPKGAI